MKKMSRMEFRFVDLKNLVNDMHQGINTVADKIEYEEKGYPIIQSKNITQNYLDLKNVRFVTKGCYDMYVNKYKPKVGDILICNIGTIGKSLVIEKNEEFLIAWNLFLVKLNKNILLPKFLKIYLDKLKSENYYLKYLTGGTVKFVNKKKMGEIKIPIPYKNGEPDLETQQKIVKKLEIAEKLKENREKADELTKEYLNSVFLEMFGDPRTNPGGFDKKSLDDMTIITMGQSPEGSSYNESGEGTPFFQGKAEFTDKYPIVRKWTSKPSKLAFENDILMSVRAPVGTVNMSNSKCCIGRGLASIRAEEKINTNFLFYFFKLNEKFIEDLGSGSTFKAITGQQLRNLQIPLPPLDLQNQFAEIVEQVEQIKEKQTKSKKEIENLYDKLIKDSFRGEI